MAVRKPGDEDVYVGRTTKWGNPFTLRKFPRDIAIAKFEEYLNNSELLEQLNELNGKKLFCHCAPLPCHAGVLIRKSENLSIRISLINEPE